MIKALFAAGLLATLPLAFGQSAHPLVGRDVAVPSARFPAEWYPKQNGDSTDAPIAGAPYSATWTMTTTLLNSEGKPIGTYAFRTLKWRDSAGRIRDEELFSEVPNAVRTPNEITVADTVQHCQFTWAEPVAREQDRDAVVYCHSLLESRTEDGVSRLMTDPKPDVERQKYGIMIETTTTTPLGKRTMQGLEVVGVRAVTTYVDAEGKLQDTKEEEIWWSPALYESILTTVRTGQNIITFEMSGIKREEPDAGLFYPPEGYHISKQAEVPPLTVPPQP